MKAPTAESSFGPLLMLIFLLAWQGITTCEGPALIAVRGQVLH